MNTQDHMMKNGHRWFRRNGPMAAVYYPGAKTDTEPFTLFSRYGGASVFLYSDYLLPQDQAKAFVHGLPDVRVESMEDLSPADLGVDDWSQLWPETVESREFAKPDKSYAFRARLIHRTGRPLFFGYFGTEGAETYRRLISCGIPIPAIVLQDHGFGGNWAKWGGSDSPLYRHARPALPPLLYIGDSDSKPWPGYGQQTDYCLRPGAEHAIPRAIFHCTTPDPLADPRPVRRRPRGRLLKFISQGRIRDRQIIVRIDIGHRGRSGANMGRSLRIPVREGCALPWRRSVLSPAPAPTRITAAPKDFSCAE